jgi:hypothetical protein
MRIAIVGLFALLWPIVIEQRGSSPFLLRVTTAEYFGETYVERPAGGASFVFFEGEPIKVRLAIDCETVDDELVLTSLEPNVIFPITVTRDNLPIDVQMTFGNVNRIGRDGSAASMRLSERIRLQAGERLEWRAQLSTALDPGLYRLSFDIRASDSQSRAVAPRVPALSFEIKASTQQYRAEILRRAALRHVFTGGEPDLKRAEGAVSELLRLNPTSVDAYLVRELIAQARGLRDAARTDRRKASEIIDADQDQMLIRFKTPEELSALKKQMAFTNRQQ